MISPVHVSAPGLAAELFEVAEKLCYFLGPDVTAVRRPAPFSFEIELDPRAGEEERATVAREAASLIDRLAAGYRPLPVRTLFERRGGDPRLPLGASGLTAHLEEAGWARRHGPGTYACGPRFVALIEALDAHLRHLARKGLGAAERSFPALIAADTLHRAGYLTSFPQHVSFVSHLPQRGPVIERFRRANAEAPGFVIPGGAAPDAPAECLPPAVCYHRYRELAGESLPEGSIITARGTCFRYEGRHAMRDLSRLWCFQMREIVYTGDPAFVRDAAVRATRAVLALTAELDLPGVCESAADPFFADVFAEKRYVQLAHDRKFELRLPLGRNETIAVASINAHDDVFGRAFDIQAAGSNAVSGCTAFGLERLALAFVARHGLDERGWPSAVLERVG